MNRAVSWLPVMIRLTAVGYLLFFVPDLVFAITRRANALFAWGGGGDPTAVMFCTVYIVWALFLFASAKAPLGLITTVPLAACWLPVRRRD